MSDDKTEEGIRTRAVETGPFRLRLQVMAGAEGAFGPGKAAMLEAIETTGSISGAGRALEISYRRAWVLVDEMNRTWDAPLVEVQRGGKAQGARVSDFGRSVLASYRALEDRLSADLAGSAEQGLFLRHLRSTPAGTGG